MADGANIKEDIWAVLWTEGSTQVRIVSWNDADPVVEKRYIIKDKDGNARTGRCRGFDLIDLKRIVELFPEIEGMITRGEPFAVPKKSR